MGGRGARRPTSHKACLVNSPVGDMVCVVKHLRHSRQLTDASLDRSPSTHGLWHDSTAVICVSRTRIDPFMLRMREAGCGEGCEELFISHVGRDYFEVSLGVVDWRN